MSRAVRAPYDEDKDWLTQSRSDVAGGGQVRQASLVLTDAQIKTLPTVPQVIVPAQADKVIWPVFGVARLIWVADYASIDANATIAFWIGIAGAISTPLSQGSQGFVATLLAGGGPDGTHAIFTAAQRVGQSGDSYVTADAGWYDSDIVGKSLDFLAENNSTNFTGGNAGNSLQVAVVYHLFNTLTGRFE